MRATQGAKTWPVQSTRSFSSAISAATPKCGITQDGRAIVNLSVATSENWRDKQTGERKEKTEWHRVVIFNENLAKVAEQYLKKGAKVYVEGQLQTRKYTDNAGVEKYSTEVVLQQYRGELTMLDSRGGGGGGGEAAATISARRARWSVRARRPCGKENFARDLDDEVPF